MEYVKIEMLKDWLSKNVNCSLGYRALEYWVKKYWENPEEELKKLKQLGKCDHEVLEGLRNL